MMKPVTFAIFTTLATGLLLSACTSRYRLDLFIDEGGQQRKVKVENTQYIRNAVIGDPLAVDKLVRGNGNTLILTTGHRSGLVAASEDLIDYDRFTRFGVYFEFPAEIEARRYDLIDNSFVQLLERYELPTENKLFFPTVGFLLVDSVTDNKLFGTLRADFENNRGQLIKFNGQFKADLKD